MDFIDLKFFREHNNRKKTIRYSKNNSIRRLKRLEIKRLSSVNSSKVRSRHFSPYYEPSVELNSVNIDISVVCRNYQLIDLINDCRSRNVSNILLHESNDDNYIESIGNCDNMSLNQDQFEKQCLSSTKIPLHNHTMMSTLDYCESFTTVARSANLSKTSTNSFLSLIKSGLPVPNELPATEKELLDFLDVEKLFNKRCICLVCYDEFDENKRMCFRCGSTAKELVAYV